ncbi:hypothetical protein [Hyphococcus sp. DH-69]|uniref:hypothetical protein n=1 Tax=Hyphococcus formosus TaxID=3143534 RepID=UPI00398B5F21
MSTDQMERVRQICDAYGADVARWPAPLREQYGELLDELPEVRLEAEMLDGFLNAATAPRMAEDLERRVLAGFETIPENAGWFSRFRDRLPRVRLAPAGLLAGIGAMGVASGIVSASAQTPLTPETEALSYIESGLTFSELSDEETLQWDAD